MKKIKFFLGFTLGLMFCIIPNVNADTLTFDSTSGYDIYIENKDKFKEHANQFIDYYNTNLKDDYEYYIITYGSVSGSIEYTGLYMRVSNSINFSAYRPSNSDYGGYELTLYDSLLFTINGNQVTHSLSNLSNAFILFQFNSDLTSKGNFIFLYDANFPILYNKNLITQIDEFKDLSIDTLEIKNFYSDTSIIINHNENIPLLKNLLEYDSFMDYEASQKGYIEVNLDNYEYVILNLKDYSSSDAFETNLQVKGSIGITPVYEFGTTEKENITDLCNISYSDFTDYRFFVLKNDLINNAVYIVKECSDSGSSFRFDSSVFDITYVTTENVDDPVVTFGGVEYHTIPFNKLSNTVNKNEEEGFIPGESGSSLTDIVDNITSYITSFWNSLSTFMGLVTKFFNTLPIEIRAIAITTFATACTLGLLKILKS